MGLIEEFELVYWNQEQLVLGLDEAGRGPMAGPCVVSGVIFPKGYDHPEINDSKAMSEKKRNYLYEIILQDALAVYVEEISVEKIDSLNIYQAVKEAMKKIASESSTEIILSDALDFKVLDKTVIPIIKGDARSLSIAAASIVAKVTRDKIMMDLDQKYPEYGFKNNKGYGTKAHKAAILEFGRTPCHRKHFRFKDEDQLSLDI